MKACGNMSRCSKCENEILEEWGYCPVCGNPKEKFYTEEYSVSADKLIERIKGLIHEGNIHRITVRNEEGEKMLEIPITAGAIGVLLAPYLAALGVIAAFTTRCTISIERKT